MYRFFFWVFLLICVMLIVPTYLEACPACKTLDDPIAKGFNFSILFLMAMPFTVFGVIGSTVYLQYRRANRKSTDQESSTKNSS
ncbi:hypothetical protein C6503_22240 [Candidatus Poribacteria bacterium]|nr:MAG: hypothetical protein C6503_22240 [Candidatus Poribacteria bacterium]